MLPAACRLVVFVRPKVVGTVCTFKSALLVATVCSLSCFHVFIPRAVIGGMTKRQSSEAGVGTWSHVLLAVASERRWAARL